MSSLAAPFPARMAGALLTAIMSVLGLAAFAILAPDRAWAQCPVQTGDFSESADIFVMKADKSCTVEDGGYIRTNTSYRLHVTATVTGWCQTYGTSGCVPIGYYLRTASGTLPHINGSQKGIINASLGVQHYTTCGNENCTPVSCSTPPSWSASTNMGTYVYTAINKTGGGPLGCGMVGWSYPANQSITMHAVSCEPQWWQHPISQVIFHAPPGEVRVFIEESMRDQLQGPAADAMAAWNAVLVSVSFVPTPADCGSGGDCVRIVEGATGEACAATDGPQTWDSSGKVTSTRTIRLPTSPPDLNWRERSNERLQRTVAHELGHVLGLDDYESICSVQQALMGPTQSNVPFSQRCKSTQGMSLVPTPNDVLPTNESTYGTGVTATCGF